MNYSTIWTAALLTVLLMRWLFVSQGHAAVLENNLSTATPGDLLFTLTPPVPVPFSRFGVSVDGVAGDILVGSEFSETVYLFDGETGAVKRTIINPAPTHRDFFGVALDGWGNRIAIGAQGNDTVGRDAGAVFLVDAENGSLLQTFHKPSPATSDAFGTSVAMVEGNVLVGSRHDDSAAFLFDSSDGSVMQTFQNPVAGGGNFFGRSVAAFGNNVLVGAYDGSGEVYLFSESDGSLIRTFSNPTPNAGDEFGLKIAVHGNKILVGARHDDTNGNDSGAAHLFDGSTGELLHTFMNPIPFVGSRFGQSVAFVGDNVLVGGPSYQSFGDGGAAFMFDSSTFNLLQSFPNPNPSPSSGYGITVAGVGNNAVVGAYIAGGFTTGIAYAFVAIPEPTALTLTVLGLFGLIARGRRRRAR